MSGGWVEERRGVHIDVSININVNVNMDMDVQKRCTSLKAAEQEGWIGNYYIL